MCLCIAKAFSRLKLTSLKNVFWYSFAGSRENRVHQRASVFHFAEVASNRVRFSQLGSKPSQLGSRSSIGRAHPGNCLFLYSRSRSRSWSRVARLPRSKCAPRGSVSLTTPFRNKSERKSTRTAHAVLVQFYPYPWRLGFSVYDLAGEQNTMLLSSKMERSNVCKNG